MLDVLKETNLITTEVEGEDELFNIHFRRVTEEVNAPDTETRDVSKLAKKLCESLAMFSKKSNRMGYRLKEELIVRSFWSKNTSLRPGHLQG